MMKPLVEKLGRISVWLLPAVAWAAVVWQLAPDWSTNAQYQHGWLVPVLAGYLWWLRREEAPQAARGFDKSGPGVVVLSALFAVVLVVREPNPDWRLIGWVFTLVAAGISLLVAAGRSGWPRARHFAFPLLFCFTAVPWPSVQEKAIMSVLMKTNAAVATEVLRWLGQSADAQGAVIRLPESLVGVDEACSGVRSLQSGLMAALFLGEMLRLGWGRRLVLLGSGLGAALLANAGRTSWLGWLASARGMPAMHHWHDTAGLLALGAGFVVLAGVSALLARGRTSGVRGGGGRTGAGNTEAGSLGRWCLVSLLVMAAGWGGTQAWFGWNETQEVRQPAWSARWPQDRPGFRELTVSEAVQAQLSCDRAAAAGWTDAQGRRWNGQFFRWEPGNKGSGAVIDHDPRLCLTGVGMELVAEHPDVVVERGELKLVFNVFEFKQRGEHVFVFNGVGEDVTRPGLERLQGGQFGNAQRLNAVAAGLRYVGQRRVVLGRRRMEVGLWGAASPQEADAAFREFIATGLVVDGVAAK